MDRRGGRFSFPANKSRFRYLWVDEKSEKWLCTRRVGKKKKEIPGRGAGGEAASAASGRSDASDVREKVTFLSSWRAEEKRG